MITYRPRGRVTISVSTVVVAASEAEAIVIAESRGLESIYPQGNERGEWTTSGELDGSVENVGIEEERSL